MTNAAFQAFLKEFGDRLCVITLDNNAKIYCEYESGGGNSSVKVKDIEFRTIGGVDMFAVPSWPMNRKEVEMGIKHQVWHPTFTIQALVLIDEDHKHFRVDPMQY